MAESPAPTDDERMRAAIDLATGQPSPSARAMAAAARPFTRRGTLVAVGIATAVVLAVESPGGRGSAGVPPVPAWRETLSWGFIAAAVLGVVVLVVAFLRSGLIGRWRSSPLRVLTEQQRAQLRRQLDSEEAIVVDELPLTRMMAADGLRTVPVVWWWIPATSVFVAGALRSAESPTWLFAAAYAALAATSVVRSRTRAQHLRTFLDLHTPATTPEATP